MTLDCYQNFILMTEFLFRLISWEQIDGIWPNFAYVLILTRSMLGLLSVNFRKFIIELWPLIDVRISFLLNILRTNWWNLTKFWIYIDTDKLWIRIASCQFSQTYNRVMALDWCQNCVSDQYLENKLMEFDQILHIPLYWEDLGWDYYKSISQICIKLMTLDWRQNFVSAQYLEDYSQDGFWPNFAYALILTTSRLGLIQV